MTTDSGTGSPAVDQVIFGFVATASGEEMGVAASSIPPGSHELRKWHERLKYYFRLEPDRSGVTPYVPAYALSYLDFGDGTAALQRRLPSADDPGRNLSHALVGAASQLSPLSAYLDEWAGWRDQDPACPLVPVPVAELAEVQRASLDHMDTEAARLGQEVLPLVRALLAEPGTGFSMFDVARDAELPLVRLLRRVLEPLLDDAAPAFPWTFSTFELSDDRRRPDLPALVFLPGVPIAGDTLHRRVYVKDPLDLRDVDTRLARVLIQDYLERFEAGDPVGYATRIWEQVRGLRDMRQRVALVRDVWLRQPAGRQAVPSAAPTPASPEADGLAHHPPVSSPPAHTHPRPVRILAHIDLPDQELISCAAGATDASTCSALIRVMRGRVETAPERDWVSVHDALSRAGFLIPAIDRLLERQEDKGHAFTTVLEFAYGPRVRDLAEQAKLEMLAIRLSQPGTDPIFVHVGNALAELNGVGKELRACLGAQWLADRQLEAPLDIRLVSSTQAGVRELLGSLGAPRLPVLVVVLIAVVACITGFVLGRLG